MFGKLAETCGMAKNGVKVLVDGRLDISEYTDKEGENRVTSRILADTCRLLQTQRGGLTASPSLSFLVRGGSHPPPLKHRLAE